MALLEPDRPQRKDRRAEWRELKQAYLAGLRERSGIEVRWRRGRVASAPGGTVMVLGSSENRPGQWWFGLNEPDFTRHEPRVLGVILLARHGDELMDFGLSRGVVESLLPTLSRSADEVKLNLVRAGSAYVLRTPRGDHDITATRGEVSWLAEAAPERSAAGAMLAADAPATFVTEPAPGPVEGHDTQEFFARFVGGRLEPLDEIALEEGDLVLVRAERRESVPSSPVLRRVVARGGPTDLPSDLAEQHDRYAHGARLS